MREIDGLKGSQLRQIIKVSSLEKELVIISKPSSTIRATKFESEVQIFLCIVAFGTNLQLQNIDENFIETLPCAIQKLAIFSNSRTTSVGNYNLCLQLCFCYTFP